MKNSIGAWWGIVAVGAIIYVGCDNENNGGIDDNGSDIDPLEMVFVEGGTFTREGASVTVGDFFIGKYEVTHGLWRSVMGTAPSRFTGNDNLPVEQVSWHDARLFIEKLNLQTAGGYRLPTEAEWEFAARGGRNSGEKYDYSGGDDINAVAWYIGNSGNRTHAAGTKAQNELGIYDMSGNVWEWVNDWYGSYDSSSQTDPTGPDTGFTRVNRGCSWNAGWLDCRVSNRRGSSPNSSYYNLGFRLASYLSTGPATEIDDKEE